MTRAFNVCCDAAVHKAIDKVDLTQTSAMMLEGLTRDNRHQKLLDSLNKTN